MASKEQELIIRRLVSLKPNERLFRINAGMGWTGKIVRRDNDVAILQNPRPFHAAPTGFPDLCGWTSITVTPDMVGQKIAVFTGEEIKATGRLSKTQKIFRDIIIRMGGIYRIIKNSETPV